MLIEIDGYTGVGAAPVKKTIAKAAPSPAKQHNIRSKLKDIEKRYLHLQNHVPALAPAQAAIEAQFLAARRGFATLPPVATADGDRCGPTDAPVLNEHALLMCVATAMDAIVKSRRSDCVPHRLQRLQRTSVHSLTREWIAFDALLEMHAAGENGE